MTVQILTRNRYYINDDIHSCLYTYQFQLSMSGISNIWACGTLVLCGWNIKLGVNRGNTTNLRMSPRSIELRTVCVSIRLTYLVRKLVIYSNWIAKLFFIIFMSLNLIFKQLRLSVDAPFQHWVRPTHKRILNHAGHVH